MPILRLGRDLWEEIGNSQVLSYSKPARFKHALLRPGELYEAEALVRQDQISKQEHLLTRS